MLYKLSENNVTKDWRNPFLLISVVLVIIALLDSMIMWGVPTTGKIVTYVLKFLILLSLPFLIHSNKQGNFAWALAVLPFTWILFDEKSILSFFQYFYSGVLPILAFFLLPPSFRKWCVLTFMDVVCRLFVIGFLFYLVLNFFGVPPHLTYIRDSDGRTYYNFFFLYYTQGLDPLTLIRFTSAWDEPGVVGTMCGMILFYFRSELSKRQFWIYLIAGTLSLSMFFLLLIIPVLYFSKFRELTRYKQVIKGSLFLLLIIIGYFSFSFLASKTVDHPVLKFSIHSRFKWDGPFIVGVHSNRDVMDGFEEAYQKFVRKGGFEYWLTGKGKNSTVEEFGSTGLSHRILIYEKGVVILIYIAVFYILLHNNWRKDFVFNLVSLVFLLLLFTQRPLLYGLYFVMVIYSGLRLHNYRNIEWLK
ncbi:hypothetical protein [Sphingobacterium paucimobilis]|uniref:Uncharacterized protein n=1 Tax=Sphingobacterium paucimobilis HER1398 TaxID=1346330 RepID=U2H7P5_9SPHI|nr:hypothetical protein [Sphingobacterium paucimobilis]ERJ57726.1 hypothetical protein M472_03000 [Sphingobacterium paucimobilis HER1398]